MTKPNRFASIIEAANEGPEDPEPAPMVAAPLAAPTPPALPREAPSKGVGRPKGKRSDPNFEQVSAYLPSELYARVRIALIEDGRRHDFSVVMAELLSAWLDSRKAG